MPRNTFQHTELCAQMNTGWKTGMWGCYRGGFIKLVCNGTRFTQYCNTFFATTRVFII